MCDPATITLAALSIAGTLASASGQQQQAEATANSQNAFNRQSEQNQLVARNQNLAALENERSTAREDATEQINVNAMALRRAESTARVSAGEAGVSGLSVDALLRDLSGRAGFDNATATENYLRQNESINARRENVQIGAVSAVNSIRNPTIQAPDYVGAALRIGQTGVGAYADYQARQDKLKNPQGR